MFNKEITLVIRYKACKYLLPFHSCIFILLIDSLYVLYFELVFLIDFALASYAFQVISKNKKIIIAHTEVKGYFPYVFL